MEDSMAYRCDIRIGMASVDAAGRIFYPELFRLAHECFEDFMRHLGMEIRQWLNEGDLILPVVHAEADYHHPIRLGDELEAALAVRRIGETSLTLACDFFRAIENRQCVASVRTVHVCVDSPTNRPTPVPAHLREKLAPWMIV